MEDKSIVYWLYSCSVYTVESILEGSQSDAVYCESGPVIKCVTISLVSLSYLMHHSKTLCLNRRVYLFISLKETHCVYRSFPGYVE